MHSQDEMPQKRFLRNVTSGWAQWVVVTVIAFFLSPFLVRTLGPERYGIWALVLSIITFIDLLDVGMKQSLSRFLSKYYALRDWHGLNEVVSTSTAIYAVTGGLAFAATLAVAYGFLDLVNISDELMPILRATLIVAGLSQAITFLFMTGAALGPFHRYDISNLLWVIHHIVTAVALVALLKLGYGLVSLAVALLVANALRQLVRRYVQHRLVPEIRLHPQFVRRERVQELLGYGIVSFFIVVSWKLVSGIQNVMISVYLSVAAVTYYAIAGQLMNYLRLIVNAIGVPLVPLVSHMEATGQRQGIAGLQTRIMSYLYYLTAAICVGILVFGRQFIFLWMGPDFGVTVRILNILVVPACLSLPQVSAHSVLLGMSRHKILAVVLLAEGIATLVLNLVLVREMGLVGVAWGTAIPQVVVYGFFYPRIFQRNVGGSLREFYGQSAQMILQGAACTFPVALAVLALNPLGGWAGLASSVLVVVAAGTAGFWFWILDANARVRLQGRFRRRRSAAASDH